MSQINEFQTEQATLENIISDKTTMSARHLSFNEAVAESRSVIDLLTKERDEAEKSFIRGQTSVEKVRDADTKLKTADEKLASLERLQRIASDELEKLDRDITVATQRVQAAKRDFVLTEKERIGKSLNADAKIRAHLMEAYAAMLSNPQGFNGDWRIFIISVFSTPPSQTEIDSAMSSFAEKHGLNQ